MELDDLKQLYKKEEINETPAISLEKQKEIHLPLEKIRKNMRMEFWSTAMAVFVVSFTVLPVTKHYTKEANVIFILFLVTFLFIVIYFFSKFYQLYHKIPNESAVTKERISELLFDLKITTEIYKDYYIACIPLFLAEFVILFYLPNNHFVISSTLFVVLFVLSCIFIVLFGLWWFRYFYGKYISKVEAIYNNLK